MFTARRSESSDNEPADEFANNMGRVNAGSTTSTIGSLNRTIGITAVNNFVHQQRQYVRLSHQLRFGPSVCRLRHG